MSPDKKWKILCYRFIGRHRRLAAFEKLKVPPSIIEREKALIQKAYEEMREACLADKDYEAAWEMRKKK